MQHPGSGGGVRVAEVMAALSLATDLGMGQPLEHALSSCVLATRLGEALDLDETTLQGVYYQALLRYIGCNAETDTLATLVGDEFAIRSAYAAIDSANLTQVIGMVVRTIRQTQTNDSPLDLARRLTRGLLSGPQINATFAGHCEVAQQLAQRLGFEDPIVLALGQIYERWDGKGQPKGLKGDAIAPAVQIVSLAQDALTIHRIGGLDAAVAMVRERSGKAYSPACASCFCERARTLFQDLDDAPAWERVMDLEPGKRKIFTADRLDGACQAMAHFVDIKSPYTLNHSTRVAEVVAAAATACGLPADDVRDLRRAGWLHDLGRAGVSVTIWHKPGPLTTREWEQVRLHPYYTERVLAHPPALARLGKLASYHHERLDSSGYHRGVSSDALSTQARILAAADVFVALTEDRTYRPARSKEAALEELQKEALKGRLDPDVVAGVLAAVRQTPTSTARDLTAGLSAREIEVVRLVAQGLTIKQIARTLVIAEKTVDNHIQHIYAKIGVSTRAGATLFAMQHRLLDS